MDSSMEVVEHEGLLSSIFMHDGLPTQVGFISIRDEVVDPMTMDRAGGHIHFQITSGTNQLIDISQTLVRISGRMVNRNGNLIPMQNAAGADNPNDRATVINGLGHAWFKNVEVMLNNTNFSPADGMYAFRGDLETRFSNTRERKKGALSLCGWEEESNAFDGLGDAAIAWYDDNPPHRSLVSRFNKNRASRQFILFSKIHSDIFQQPKLMPPNTTIDIKFDRNSDEFVLLTNENPLTHHLRMETCQLYVRKIRVNPEVVNDLIAATTIERPMKFPIREVFMTYFTKTAGSTDFSETNILKKGSTLPRRVMIGLVRQDSFHGTSERDPFNYQPFGTNYVCLRIGGQIAPYPEIKCDPDTHQYADALFSVLRGTTGFDQGENDLGITIDNVHKRNFVMIWNISPSDAPSGNSYDMENVQSIDVVWRIQNALGHAVTMVVMAEYDESIECDREGNFKKTQLKNQTAAVVAA